MPFEQSVRGSDSVRYLDELQFRSHITDNRLKNVG